MSQKLQFWPKIAFFGLIWPNLAPKTNFLGQNDYSIISYETIFGPTFAATLENLLERFFRNVPKNCEFGQKWPFFGLFRPNLAPKTNFLGQNDYSIL